MSNTPQDPDLFLTLLLGGVRAGKSSRALQLASAARNQFSDNVLFVATAQAFDAEMEKRIASHRAERPVTWNTLEEPLRLATVIDHWLAEHPLTPVVVIDCITLWVSNLMLANSDCDNIEQLVGEETRRLLQTMRLHASLDTPSGIVARQWIVVSNEVGLGVVPPSPLGRLYRDALGRANQLLAAAADEVTLLVAGLPLPLKTRARV